MAVEFLRMQFLLIDVHNYNAYDGTMNFWELVLIFSSHLEVVIVTRWMVFQVEISKGDGDVSTCFHGDGPHTVTVDWVVAWVTRRLQIAVVGASQSPTTDWGNEDIWINE